MTELCKLHSGQVKHVFTFWTTLMKALYASLYFSFSLIIINSQNQGPPSFWVNRKKLHLLQGNKDQILRGAGEQYLGAGKFPISWGTSQIIFRGARERGGLQYLVE